MQILKFPDPHLFKKCTDVTKFDSQLLSTLNQMYEVMIQADGMGLAANQVGLNFNGLVMLGPNHTKFFIINPRVILRSEIPANLPEACLSLPGEWVTLFERPQWVQISYQDEKGHQFSKVFTNIFAVCVLHEMDHLAGRAFFESISIPKEKRKELTKKYGKPKKQKPIF